MKDASTIVAIATATGNGAIGIIRISGENAITIAQKVFHSKKNKALATLPPHSTILGDFKDDDRVIDEVLCTVFKKPHSYTGEDVVEFSCHGSPYIQESLVKVLLKNGCRTAQEGEFTLRAFLGGKMDLSQAEAVADLISCKSQAAHQIAINQMRGGISNELESLRQQLLNFTALIELELDFAEEDVNFADRKAFESLLRHIQQTLKNLIDSFHYGNAIKNGIPIAIVGTPNTGKSTLLNTLSKEEKAIVSDIEGTTRDAIEHECTIEGIRFRFVDTAGIRTTTDVVENIGIEKTYEKAQEAAMVLLMIPADVHFNHPTETQNTLKNLQQKLPNTTIQIVLNKMDLIQTPRDLPKGFIGISAKHQRGIEQLKKHLLQSVQSGVSQSEVIISNARHYEALCLALEALDNVMTGIQNNIPSDLFAIDVRACLTQLGNITGAIDVDQDILGNIFANFCIGK